MEEVVSLWLFTQRVRDKKLVKMSFWSANMMSEGRAKKLKFDDDDNDGKYVN